MARYAMQAAMRAAAMSLLQDFASAQSIALQIYPGRPRTLRPPAAFIDSVNEPSITYTGLRQRTPEAVVVVVHGLFDSAEAVAQKDDFVDAFIDYVTDNYYAAGAATLISVSSTLDLPNFVPDWMPEQEQVAYYATRIVLEGLTLDAN